MTKPFVLTTEEIAQGWRLHDGGACPFKKGVPYDFMFDNHSHHGPHVSKFPRDWPWSACPPHRQIRAYRVYLAETPAIRAALGTL